MAATAWKRGTVSYTHLFLAFQAASGDNHPIHYDAEYCRARGMPGMLAHGLQTLIQTAAGAGLFPYLTEDSLIGFLDQSSRFLKPVFVGDTLYPALEVVELTPNRSTGVVGLASIVHNLSLIHICQFWSSGERPRSEGLCP